MRQLIGVGTPRGLQGRPIAALASLIALIRTLCCRPMVIGHSCAARAARRYPVILELFEQGTITLTAVRLLAPHLTDENHVAVLKSATHKSKREIEGLVCALKPRPDAPAVVRRLPTPRAVVVQPVTSVPSAPSASGIGATSPAVVAGRRERVPVPEASPTSIAPLAPERYRIQLTVSRETHDKFRRVQALLRHALPSGDPAAIFDRAVTQLVDQLERQRFAQTDRARATTLRPRSSRHIPARCGARCGAVMVAAARSSGTKDAAVSVRSWSSTTWSPMLSAERRRSRTSSCAAARTTRTRHGCSSARTSCGKSAPGGRTRSGTS